MAKPLHHARAAALQAGESHYDGNPCSQGHTRRHTQSGSCAACQAEAQRKRRRAARPTLHDDILG